MEQLFFFIIIKYKFRSSLTCLISLFLLLSCSSKNSESKDSFNYQANNQIVDSVSDINYQLLFVVKEVIDSNEERIFFRPEIGYQEYFYCLRFFKQKENLYLTSWVSWSFPFSQFYNDALFSYDTSCMYYFNLFNRNVIIMDSPENRGHDLFQKSSRRNLLAMQKKKEIEVLLSKYSPIMFDREKFQRTYRISDRGTLIQCKKVVFSPPYISEKKSMIKIIDL